MSANTYAIAQLGALCNGDHQRRRRSREFRARFLYTVRRVGADGAHSARRAHVYTGPGIGADRGAPASHRCRG